jgi:hypothetical protein
MMSESITPHDRKLLAVLVDDHIYDNDTDRAMTATIRKLLNAHDSLVSLLGECATALETALPYVEDALEPMSDGGPEEDAPEELITIGNTLAKVRTKLEEMDHG